MARRGTSPGDLLRVGADARDDLLWTAAGALDSGDLPTATRLYGLAATLWPDRADGHLGLGACRHADGATADAAAHYRRALDADPSSPHAAANLAECALALGRRDEAARLLHSAGRVRRELHARFDALRRRASNAEEVAMSRPGGFFISLDGPDGGGKTTQVARLVAWLSEQGREAVACRDPGGTPLGDRVRGLLLDRHGIRLDMRAEMFLYMASRAQLVDEIIRPALDAGRVVVCDRFLLANVVYQGHAGGLPVEDLWALGRVATGGRMPDLTLLIDVPPETAHARVGTPRDRLEDRPDSYRAAVRDGFRAATRDYPAPLVTIDGTADADAVAGRIQQEVSRALALRPRS